MSKKFISFITAIVIFAMFIVPVSAENLTADEFELRVTIPEHEAFSPFSMRFNLFTEGDTWISNKSLDVSAPGTYTISFPIKYEIGLNFKIVSTVDTYTFEYSGSEFGAFEPCLVKTYYSDENNTRHICNYADILVTPFYATYEYSVEKFVNERNIASDTVYLVWVSKANYKVNVFLGSAGTWNYIKSFPCSIGAKDTPTVTGEFVYHQQQPRWQYDGYYVGPIMRFYRGYAIHTTLINNNGTDRDARIGKMISHGCVRVLPSDMQWLIYYIPLNTKIYVTDE